MEKLSALARNLIATLWQKWCVGLLSHLCGLRNPDDQLLPEVPPSNNRLDVVATPNLPDNITDHSDTCNGCAEKSKAAGFVIFVLGAPGAGKGTQCAFLAQQFGFRHLSYGDLCRRLKRDSRSIVSKLDTKPGSNNPAVPDDLGAWLMWKEIRTDPGRHWLVDGFPKRIEHLEEFLTLMPTPSLTLFFKCPQEISLQRVAKRGKTAGDHARPEDLDGSVSRKRVEDFYSNMISVMQALQDRKMKLAVVDTNRPENLIQDELRQIMFANGLAR